MPPEDGVDLSSAIDEQVTWLTDTGLDPNVVFARDDLAILVADRAPA